MDITQRLGFEASQAISTLNQLNSAIGGVNRRLSRFNTLTAASSQADGTRAFNNVANAAARAENSLRGVGTRFDEAGRKGTQAGNSISVSWETLARVIATQALVRTLNNAIQLFGEAADQAEEFQLTIARTANIADGPAGTIDNLTRSVRDLAVTLGRDVDEVAGAAFEALQNDLGTTAETLDIVGGAANRLALVTGGTLTEGVNAISSVLKSFNLDATDASRVVDDFFGAIDAGRISLSELQSSLGNVTPLAANLGVTFRETAGSIAAITQNGVTAARAQTQLRNVLQRLIDPTESLQAAFEQLGVTTGRELIQQQGGLIGALQELTRVAPAGSQAFADFFGTIRGNLGALNLLSNDAQVVTRILGELEGSAGRAAEATDAIDNTDARRSQRAFAQLNDTILGLGETFQQLRTFAVETFNAIIPNTEAAENALILVGAALTGGLIAAIPVAVSALGTLTAAVGTFGIALTASTGGLLAVGAAIGALVGGGIIALDAVFTDASERIAAANERIATSSEESRQRLADENAAATAELSASLAEREDAIRQSTDIIRQEFDNQVSDAQNFSRSIGESLEFNAETFVSSIEEIFDRIESRIRQLDDDIAQSAARSAGLSEQIAERAFQASIRNLDPDRQLQASLSRLQTQFFQIGAQLRQAIQSGADPSVLSGIQDSFEQLQRQADRLSRSRAEGATGSRAVAAAERLAFQALVEQRTVQDAITRALGNQRNIADELAGSQRNVKDEAVEAANEIARATQAALANDGVIDEVEQANLDRLGAGLQEVLGGFSREFFNAFGEAQNVEVAVQRFTTAFNSARFEFANLREDFQAVLDQQPFQALVQLLDERTGNEAVDNQLTAADNASGPNPADRANAQIQATEQAINQVRELENRAENLRETLINTTREGSQLAAQGTRDIFTDNLLSIDGAARDTAVRLNQAIQEIFTQIRQGSFAEGQAEQVEQEIERLRGLVNTLFEGDAISSGIAETLNAALDQANQARELVLDIDRINLDNVSSESLTERLNQLIDQVQQSANQIEVQVQGVDQAAEVTSQLTNQLSASATEAQSLSTQLSSSQSNANATAGATGTLSGNLSSASTQANSLASAFNRVEAAARAAAAAAASISTQTPQFANDGGKIAFRQGGGSLTRGSDTRLAALTPGEFVVNARQSRNFAAQLQAINAGQSPQFRENGGSVTNVGDINVNVNTTSETSAGISRDIARQLRRDVQRGNIKLS